MVLIAATLAVYLTLNCALCTERLFWFAASERNLSPLGFIHSKLRSFLGVETSRKLLFYLKNNNTSDC
jgi:hypothetical protein